MSREIKFRAWHKENKQMVCPDNILIDGDWIRIDFEDNAYPDGSASWYMDNEDGNEIMQYTGLKDKNGEEIYEGDIVKWDDRSNGKYWRVAIVKINPDIQFETFHCKTIPNSESTHTYHYGSFIYTDTENHLEVIGNIYENPKLLK